MKRFLILRGFATIVARMATSVVALCAILFVSCEDSFQESESLPVESISLDYETLDIAFCGTDYLTDSFTPAKAFNKIVAWSMSNEGIVSVGSDGEVTALKVGTTTVTATSRDGGYTASCEVTVVKSEDYVDVTGFDVLSLSVMASKSDTIERKFTPEDASNQSVHWSIKKADPEGCLILDSTTGVVEGIKPGVATILAVSDEGDIEKECTVTVTEFVPTPVTSIVMDESRSIVNGISFTLDYEVNPEGYTSPLNWSIEPVTTPGGITIDAQTGLITTVVEYSEAYIVLTADNSEARAMGQYVYDVVAKCLIKVVPDYIVDEDGTIEIYSAKGLIAFNEMATANPALNGRLLDNIDLSQESVVDWSPIGSVGAPYTGTFDGGGFKISNLNINSNHYASTSSVSQVYFGHTYTVTTLDVNEDVNVGLFGYLSGATIKNLVVEGGYIYGLRNIGTIAGYVTDGSTLFNCTGATDCQACLYDVGSLAGYVTGGSKIIACVGNSQTFASGSTQDIYADAGTVTNVKYTGGLIGSATNVTIVGCSTLGYVKTSLQAGGLVCMLLTASDNYVYGTYASATVNKAADVGFAQYCQATVEGSYWAKTSSCNATGIYLYGSTNGITELTRETLNVSTPIAAMNSAISTAGYGSNIKFVAGSEYPVIEVIKDLE